MHSFYFSCQICHIRPKKERTFTYRWYDVKTGALIPTPKLGEKPLDELGIKLIPCEKKGGIWRRLDSDQEIAYANKFIEEAKTKKLSLKRKKEAIEKIHRHISKETITCQECHNRTSPFIPFRDIGYTQKKISYLVSEEVVGMIKKYKDFYMRSVVHPPQKE